MRLETLQPLYLNYEDAMDNVFCNLTGSVNFGESVKSRLAQLIVEEEGKLLVKTEFRYIFSNQL